LLVFPIVYHKALHVREMKKSMKQAAFNHSL